MPEAPVDEDDLPTPWKHYVRRTRKIASVQQKTIAEPMEQTPYHEFGRRIFWPDPGHQRATGQRHELVPFSSTTGGHSLLSL